MIVILWLYHGIAWTWGGTPFRSAATGYNIVSGDLGDLALLGAAWAVFRHHICYMPGCLRPGHPHPEHDHQPVCRKHRSRVSGSVAE